MRGAAVRRISNRAFGGCAAQSNGGVGLRTAHPLSSPCLHSQDLMSAIKFALFRSTKSLASGGAYRSLPLALIGVLWLLCVLAGIGLLWKHARAAGELDSPPANWPTLSSLPREPGRPTLLFFAHPKCPCTLASLRELDRLLAHTSQPINTLVVFNRPKGVPDDWTDTAVCSLAEGIAGVQTYVDDGGTEASRFAAKTSGQVCLYGADDRLLFHGGITGARGHEGDNVGRSAVTSHLGGLPADTCSPVYGCSLHTPPPRTGG